MLCQRITSQKRIKIGELIRTNIKCSFPFEEPTLLNKLKYNFDLNKAGEYGWKESAGKKRFYSSKRLIEKSMDMFFSKIRDEIIKQ